ncbi:NADH-quinone oxidoreductase subunit J [Planctomycetota bacterium]
MEAIFILASIAAVVSSLLMVTRRNPVYAAACMLGTLCSLAVLFLLLSSTFLAVVQVLLYAGAILVLFVFVIMLLNPSDEDLAAQRPPFRQRAVAFVIAASILVAVGVNVVGSKSGVPTSFSFTERPAKPVLKKASAKEPQGEDTELVFGSTRFFGYTIYDRHVVAFELVSLLILASIVGVVLVAKRKLEPEEPCSGPPTDEPPLVEAKGAAGSDDTPALGEVGA